MIHGTRMKKKFSHKVGADPGDSESSTNDHFKVPHGVDVRLTITQVTSTQETTWPEVWSSMSKGGQKRAKQQWDMDTAKFTSCTLDDENS